MIYLIFVRLKVKLVNVFINIFISNTKLAMNLNNQPVIKWTGSKRSQFNQISPLIPSFINYYEPFLGGGSVMYNLSPQNAICSDICTPLIDFFVLLKNNPVELINSYNHNWNELKKDINYYYQVREKFNQTKNPNDFLFLTRTCVNGLIRFNKKGDFNSPYHLNRFGIQPEKLEIIINNWHKKIKNYIFKNCDYKEIINEFVNKGDFIYLDPPYFNTKSIYSGGISLTELCEQLEILNQKGVKFMLSYDGISTQDNTVSLPKELFKQHFYLNSGNSSYNRIFSGKNNIDVKESLYINY